MDKGTKRLGFVYKLEQLTVVRAVRGGLVSLIPVLIIGAFSLILQTFPVTVTNNRKADRCTIIQKTPSKGVFFAVCFGLPETIPRSWRRSTRSAASRPGTV